MNGCEFCTDLRNIQPAKYIGYHKGIKEVAEFFEKAKAEKKFILETENAFEIVDKCPKCGHVFTEKDYDKYI